MYSSSWFGHLFVLVPIQAIVHFVAEGAEEKVRASYSRDEEMVLLEPHIRTGTT